MKMRMTGRATAIAIALVQAAPSAAASARAPLPLASARAHGEERRVLQAMELFFQAIREGHPDIVASVLLPNGSLFFERRNPDGGYTLNHLSNADWLSHMRSWGLRVQDENWNSRVQIWGPIATVTQSFAFVVDGRIKHCGINLLQMVKDKQDWRIANIAWTEERSGCALPRSGAWAH